MFRPGGWRDGLTSESLVRTSISRVRCCNPGRKGTNSTDREGSRSRDEYQGPVVNW